MLRSLICALLIVAAPSWAAPPGPPPQYQAQAADLLSRNLDAKTLDQVAGLLADDVTLIENGRTVSTSKAAWLAAERARLGNVQRQFLGYTIGLEGMLVFDRVDDYTGVPPGALADPRWVTRSILYEFGADRRIHRIQIVKASNGPFHLSADDVRR